MPIKLSDMPPTALCSATDRSRWPMWNRASTVSRDVSMIHGASRFGRDVAVLAKCHTDGCGRERGRVVDAVAQKKCRRLGGFRADEGQFVLGGLSSNTSVMPTCSARYRTPAAIDRDQQHAIDAMPTPEMRDERRAVDARFVTEAARGGVAIVNHHHALHTAHDVRQLRAQAGISARSVARLAISTRDPSTTPRSPRPAGSLTSLASRSATPASVAAATTALASGCLE